MVPLLALHRLTYIHVQQNRVLSMDNLENRLVLFPPGNHSKILLRDFDDILLLLLKSHIESSVTEHTIQINIMHTVIFDVIAS